MESLSQDTHSQQGRSGRRMTEDRWGSRYREGRKGRETEEDEAKRKSRAGGALPKGTLLSGKIARGKKLKWTSRN